MHSIDASKAPRIDGFNAHFFKSAWNIIKEDVYKAIKEFFLAGIMARQWNCTIITLVPKIQHPQFIKDFRPIACCTML